MNQGGFRIRMKVRGILCLMKCHETHESLNHYNKDKLRTIVAEPGRVIRKE